MKLEPGHQQHSGQENHKLNRPGGFFPWSKKIRIVQEGPAKTFCGHLLPRFYLVTLSNAGCRHHQKVGGQNVESMHACQKRSGPRNDWSFTVAHQKQVQNQFHRIEMYLYLYYNINWFTQILFLHYGGNRNTHAEEQLYRTTAFIRKELAICVCTCISKTINSKNSFSCLYFCLITDYAGLGLPQSPFQRTISTPLKVGLKWGVCQCSKWVQSG